MRKTKQPKEKTDRRRPEEEKFPAQETKPEKAPQAKRKKLPPGEPVLPMLSTRERRMMLRQEKREMKQKRRADKKQARLTKKRQKNINWRKPDISGRQAGRLARQRDRRSRALGTPGRYRTGLPARKHPVQRATAVVVTLSLAAAGFAVFVFNVPGWQPLDVRKITAAPQRGYVFDGQGETPWQPDCKDYKPLNVYGQTKLEGELAVANTLDKFFIVRIAWVFGLNGNNFIRTMLKLSDKYDTLRVVCDQVGTPTYTLDLSRLLADMVQTEKYGYYHATNEGGYISWYDFACEIFRQAGKSVAVNPVTTAEYGLSKAARPYNSRLDKTKLVSMGFSPLPTWQDALSRYLKEIGE